MIQPTTYRAAITCPNKKKLKDRRFRKFCHENKYWHLRDPSKLKRQFKDISFVSEVTKLYYGLHLWWHTDNLDMNKWKVILPMGEYKYLNFTNSTEVFDENSTLILVWIHDHNVNYPFSSPDEQVKNCNYGTEGVCFSFVSAGGDSTHTVLIQKVTVKYHELNTDYAQAFYPKVPYLSIARLLSWKQASVLCTKQNALLPYFTNKQDLEDFMAFLKVGSKGLLSPIEGLFVGLKFKASIWSLNVSMGTVQVTTDTTHLTRIQSFWTWRFLTLLQQSWIIFYHQWSVKNSL